ncbi:MAG: hypothetical protein E2O54_02480 [Gammaproteobacteria bacterium]|nr:MAG: hypothetical protein E2O54_02480 [Gammaproteobacteria bacterium]
MRRSVRVIASFRRASFRRASFRRASFRRASLRWCHATRHPRRSPRRTAWPPDNRSGRPPR